MLKYIKSKIKYMLVFYTQYICKKEFGNQDASALNERPVEFRFVFEQLSELYPHKILDVGTGTTALPHIIRNCGFIVTAVDNIKDYWPTGMYNRHFLVLDDDITNTRLTEKYDLITCISVLEHIEEHDAAVKNMFDLLNAGGHLVMSFPYNENTYEQNVYIRPKSTCGQNAPYVCQAYSRENIDNWLDMNNGKLIKQEYWQFWEGEYWTEGSEVIPPIKSSKEKKHQLTCILLKKL